MTEPGRRRSLFPASRGAFVADRLIRPAQAFLHTEAAGGVVLLVAAIIAIIWANSPWDQQYFDLWHTELVFDFHLFAIDEDLGHLVNDGLMAIFFFVVGLEIKRELVHGELASPRRAIFPVAAALGGMIMPALIFTAWNFGGEGAHGWGIPMATDIAFAVGVLSLVGSRVPFSLKVFLLALAIADDLGAIVVIAVFYTESLSMEAIAWGAGLLAVVIGMRMAGVRATYLYLFVGALFWVAVLKSGIHATVAGVVLAMLTPAKPLHERRSFEALASSLLERFRQARELGDEEMEEALLERMEELSRDSEAPLDRLEHALHPWVRYGIVPIFALANAGVVVTSDTLSEALSSSVTLGIVTGLVFGKLIGITLFAWLSVRLGWAALPAGVRWRDIGGVALLGGIGFTVSLFITGLSFDPAHVNLTNEAKMGILGASAIAGLVGFIILRWEMPSQPATVEAEAVPGVPSPEAGGGS
ncbi:MAG TPA: Na+/H+ antiporter NhaA [Tepidiformaceae bacterium]